MEITIKKEITETITVSLPKFWKKEDISGIELLGVIDAENVIRLMSRKGYWSVISYPVDNMTHEINKAVNDKWDEISEDEWFELYGGELRKFSLTPIATS